MKSERYVIIGLIIVMVFSITCGCSTTVPSAETGKTVTTAGPATDAGLRIITEEFPPFNYAGANGTVTGQTTDIVNNILTRLNQKAEISILPWSEGYGIALARPHVALYSTARTDEREHLFKWVGPVASYDFMLYAKNGTHLQVNSLEAAKKVGSIGVVKDDARQQFLQENQFGNIVTCSSDAECIHNLMAGSTDLWLGSSVNADDIARSQGIDPAALEAVYPVRTVQMYIAFSNDTPDSVITTWQTALDAMKSDGTFDAILKKYGTAPAPSVAVPESADALANQALNTIIATTDGKLTAILRPFEVMALTTEVPVRQVGEYPAVACYA